MPRIFLLLFATLSLSAFHVAFAGRIPGPVTTVGEHNGAKAFFFDGKPFTTPVFETYEPGVRYFKQFAEAGCEVFGFPANCGAEPWEHSQPVWVGPDVWDFSEFDEHIGMILKANPKALIFPRVYVGEPDWWREAHPEALIRFSDGSLEQKKPFRLWPEKPVRTFPSIASTQWREEMARALRRLIDHVHAASYADRIAGYHVYGQSTEEWYHFFGGDAQLGDYSDNARLGFQRWLKEKYSTAENLRKSWNQPEIDFERVGIPTAGERLDGAGLRPFRDPAREMHVIDFYQYYNELMADTIDYFCRVVKEHTNRQKVVGAFYAYLFEFGGNPESGHLAVQKLLKSQNLDFIVVTASYGNRQLGSGGSILRSPHTSLQLHGKLWYEDNDNVSYLFPQVSRRIGDQEWERSRVVLAATENAEETKWIYQRGAGFSLANGVHQSFFDLHGGYFDDPQIMADVGDLYRVFERSARQDRSSAAQILVLADEQSVFYCTKHCGLLGQNLYDPPFRLIKCGAPYDAIYVSDLDRLDLSPYKLVIVLNAYNITTEQEALIEQRLKVPGRTILWCYAPGLFNGTEQGVARMSAITGIRLAAGGKELVKPQIQLKRRTGMFVDELGGQLVGPESASSILFYVEDAQALSLGLHPESGKTVLATKQINGLTSVYTPTASLPPEFFRALARQAGVHVYNNRNDTLYANHSYLTLNADGACRRALRFPQAVNVLDAVTERVLASDAREYELEMRDKETRMLRLENASASRSRASSKPGE